MGNRPGEWPAARRDQTISGKQSKAFNALSIKNTSASHKSFVFLTTEKSTRSSSAAFAALRAAPGLRAALARTASAAEGRSQRGAWLS